MIEVGVRSEVDVRPIIEMITNREVTVTADIMVGEADTIGAGETVLQVIEADTGVVVEVVTVPVGVTAVVVTLQAVIRTLRITDPAEPNQISNFPAMKPVENELIYKKRNSFQVVALIDLVMISRQRTIRAPRDHFSWEIWTDH